MQARRDEIAEKSDGTAEYARKWLDCAKCPFNDAERSINDCGWLPKSKRSPRAMRPFPQAPVCPGYLILQPEVTEAARALSWQRKGQLEHLYEQPVTPVLRDCIDILDSACRDVEAEHMRKQRREMSRGPQ